MKIKPIRKDLELFLKSKNLVKKWQKAKNYFEKNPKHPSLHTELLEPKWRGISSFRIDLKYRALFFIDAEDMVEVFKITNHYKK